MDECVPSSDTSNANVGIAFGLVAAAGLSTTLGAAIAFCMPYRPASAGSTNLFLAASLAIAAGVMVYVSFVEIFGEKAVAEIATCVADERLAYLYATLCFFGGVALIALFDVALHAFQKWMVRRSGDGSAAAADGAHKHHDLPAHANTDSTSVVSDVDDPAAAAAVAAAAAPTDDHTVVPVEHRIPMDHELAHDGEMVAAAVYNARVPKDVPTTEPPPLREAPSDVVARAGEDADADADATAPLDAAAPTAEQDTTSARKLVRMGIFAGIAIAFHNFPEGLATFIAALQDPGVGAAVAVAIGIHNIPEGICVAMPIYYATGSKRKAFFWATLSGLTELLGAALGWAVLRKVFTPLVYGVLFGIVAGMMVYISLKELLPGAQRYDPEDKVTTIFLVLGMVIMAMSLVLFKYA